MSKKVWVFTIIVCIVFQLIPVSSSAHTTSQEGIIKDHFIKEYGGWYIGGEDIGWSIDEDLHAGTTTIAYQLHSDTGATLPVAFCLRISQAAELWSPTVNITTNAGTSNTVGNVYLYAISGTDIVASFTNYSANSNGHLTSWDIQINNFYYDEFTSITIAHEFGHVIGLNDLYDGSNINKLMYSTEAGTATAPTTADIWGAKIITGQHSVHTWTNDPYTVHTCTDCGGYGTHSPKAPYRQAGPSYHSYICSDCRQLAYQAHVWNPLTGKCTQCNYSGGVIIFTLE